MSGKRVFSITTLVIAFAAAAVWAWSGQYLIAALWALAGVGWLIRTARDWNSPLRESTHPGRDQILVGAILLSIVVALMVWSPSSPFAPG